MSLDKILHDSQSIFAACSRVFFVPKFLNVKKTLGRRLNCNGEYSFSLLSSRDGTPSGRQFSNTLKF